MTRATLEPPATTAAAAAEPTSKSRAALGGLSGSRGLARRGRVRLRGWLDHPMASWHLILGVFGLLLVFGLLMVLSASSITQLKRDGSPFSTFINQSVFAAFGLVAFALVTRLRLSTIRGLSFPAVLVSIVLLCAVFLPGIGVRRGGSYGWIGFGSWTIQPVELAKLSLLLWMAHVLASRRHTLRSPKALLIPVVPIFLLMVALLMKQPDLGGTVCLVIVFFAVFWFAGAPLWLFGAFAGFGLAGVGYFAVSAGYRSVRVTSWLHPSLENSYQLYQGLFGLGHGGLFGAGLGQSVVKWGALPAADSDFIFAIIGEELGLLGTVLVVVLYALLAYTGFRIARRNIEPFVKIVAASCTVWLVGQAAINIGYVTGLLPVTGITLPMISAGGTSLVITMIAFGLLANFARREPQAAAALATQGQGRVARFLGLRQRPVGTGRRIGWWEKAMRRTAESVRQPRPTDQRTSAARSRTSVKRSQKAAARSQKGASRSQQGAAAAPASRPSPRTTPGGTRTVRGEQQRPLEFRHDDRRAAAGRPSQRQDHRSPAPREPDRREPDRRDPRGRPQDPRSRGTDRDRQDRADRDRYDRDRYDRPEPRRDDGQRRAAPRRGYEPPQDRRRERPVPDPRGAARPAVRRPEPSQPRRRRPEDGTGRIQP